MSDSRESFLPPLMQRKPLPHSLACKIGTQLQFGHFSTTLHMGTRLRVQSSLSLIQKANEHWRVVFACRATPPYIRSCALSAGVLPKTKRVVLKERLAGASEILRAAYLTAIKSLLQTSEPRLSAQLCRGSSLGKPGSKRANFSRLEGIFLVCLSGRALPDVVVSSPCWTDMISASRAWAESTLRQRSWMRNERMTMAALKSRRSFASRLPSLPSHGKSLSRQGFSATAGRHLGDIQVTVQNAPPASKAPRTSAPPRGSVEWPKQFASPHAGPSVSFGAPQEVEMSAAASKGESEGEADVSAGRCPSAVTAPSEAVAELRLCSSEPPRRLATKVTARSLGQVMSTVVVQERHLWLTLAQMADVDKARFLDAPISQGGLFGDTVEDFAQQFSAVQKQTEAIKHILPRRNSATTSAGLNLRLPVAEGAPLRPLKHQLRPLPRHTMPDWQPDVELAAGERRCPRLRDRPGTPAGELRSVPDVGNPEVEEIALWGTTTSPLPVEGRELLCAQMLSSAYGSTVPTISQKESISSPLGLRPRVPFSSDPDSEVDITSAGTREEGCPTAVTSVNAPLIPLFARRPPRYRGVLFTTVHSDTHAAVLRAEVAVLLPKDAIEPVPPAEMKSGFYSPYFIVPKKSGGLRPILDLRALNRSLLRLPFKMLTTKRMLTCIRRQDWFAAIDLKDTYFHVSILPRHRPFLRFAFEGRAYQYKVLPFGLSLSPRVFTKVTEAALSPLWRMGIRILNYLDDWLLIAHSRDLLCKHRDLVLRHLSHLGLQVNWEKSKLSPVQRISFLGVELDSVNMTARLTNERAQSTQNISEAPGAYGSCSRGDATGLASYETASALVTRSSPEMGMAPWHTPDWLSLQCRRLFSPWSDPAFLQAGVPLGQVSRHLVVYTDASSTGWGAVCNGQAPSGSWTGPRLQWHINCLELLAVLLALRRFRPMLRHKHVLVRTDSTATVAYINHQGGLRSRRMSQLARHLLLWSQTWLKSLRAVHIPGELNRAADQLSRQSTHPGEWRLHPQRGSPRQGCTGTQLTSGAQVRLSPSEPPCTDSVQDQGGQGAGSASCAILAHPDLVSRPHFPRGSPSLEDPLEERPSFSGDGHNLAPASRPMEPARLAPGRDASDLSQGVIETITQSRAPSTRQAYALRWGLFVDWCSSHGEDPQRCPIAVVLSFLQEKLERRMSPSTLKVYVAAIAAYHDAVDGASLGKHQLIVSFLRGARRVNPPRPHLVPSWDPSIALQATPNTIARFYNLRVEAVSSRVLTKTSGEREIGWCRLAAPLLRDPCAISLSCSPR
ncbi:ORF V: Enzymatic polyprotein [Labeo rohita]|uniref:ribonuclease H n=1 Tax=Labeo rohita TaxID=84645 RepID=A0ABQ8MMT5_LABRO|nr:ORF V: Enzymatic polyprotein [Labeo rohita]